MVSGAFIAVTAIFLFRRSHPVDTCCLECAITWALCTAVTTRRFVATPPPTIGTSLMTRAWRWWRSQAMSSRRQHTYSSIRGWIRATTHRHRTGSARLVAVMWVDFLHKLMTIRHQVRRPAVRIKPKSLSARWVRLACELWLFPPPKDVFIEHQRNQQALRIILAWQGISSPFCVYSHSLPLISSQCNCVSLYFDIGLRFHFFFSCFQCYFPLHILVLLCLSSSHSLISAHS